MCVCVCVCVEQFETERAESTVQRSVQIGTHCETDAPTGGETAGTCVWGYTHIRGVCTCTHKRDMYMYTHISIQVCHFIGVTGIQ